MSKRGAGRQLIKGEDDGSDGETPTPQGGILKASDEVLKGRRIIKARKKRRAPSKVTGAVNPFAALAGAEASSAAPANPFGGLPKLEKPQAPAWSPTAVKLSSGGFSDGFTLGGPSSVGAAASSSASNAPKPLAAFSFNVGAKADAAVASAPAAEAPIALSFNFGSAKPLGSGAAKASAKSPTFAFSAAKSPAPTPQPLKSATSASSAPTGATGGASSKRARLKSLNAKFATWVAAQLACHPSADWSAAATEYSGFVRKIRTSASAASGGAGGGAAGSVSASAASSTAPAASAAAAGPAVDGEVFAQIGVLSRFQDVKTLKPGCSEKSGETVTSKGWKKWGKGTFRVVEDAPGKWRITFTQLADANTPRPKEWLNAHNASWVEAKPHPSRDTIVQFDAHDFAMPMDAANKEKGETFRYLLRVKNKAIAGNVLSTMKKHRNAV